MKKLMRTFALMAVAALGLSACTGEKLVPDNGNADGKFVTVHFGAEAAIEGATKATLTTEDEKTFKSEWENGDVLSVEYSNDNETVGATTNGVISATWATDHFEAKLPEYRGVWFYDALYPAPNAEKKVDFGSARTQNGSAYNSKYDLMKGVAIAENADAGKTADGQNIVFNMTRQTAIAYFHLTCTLDEEVVSAKLSVEGKDAYLSTSDVQIGKDSQGNTSYAQGYAFTKTEGVASKEINLTFDAGTAPKTSDFKLWFNVLPTPYDKMTLTVETANHTLTISRNANAADKYEAGKLYKVVKNIPADKWVKKGGETPAAASWIATDLADITATDEVVITMAKGESVYAMTSEKGSSDAPTAVVVTVENKELTAAPVDNLIWNIANDKGNLTIYPKGQTAKWLYTTDNNDGVRVGTNDNKTFVVDSQFGYLKNTTTNRYLGVYSNAEWRCYKTATGTSNIAGQTLCFYVKGTPKTALDTPANLAVSAAKVISWDAVSGAASYEITIGKDTFTSETTSYDAAAVVDDYYDVAVVAIPTDKVNYKNSAAATLSGVKFGTPKLTTPELAEGAIDESSIRVNMAVDARATNGCTCEIYNGETLVESKTIKVKYVVFSGLEGGITYTIKVNAIAVEGEKPYAASDVASIELTTKAAQHVSDVTAAGTYTIKGLTVYAVPNSSNAIVGDGTGFILLYKGSHGLKVGNTFNVAGTVKQFNGVWEFDSPSITGQAAGETPVYPEAVEADEAYLTSYGTATKIEYVHAMGIQSGKNIKVGAKTLYLSAENAETDGKNVEVTGFVYGYNTQYSSASFVATSIQLDSSIPHLSVDQTSKVWAADATDAFVVKVTVNSEGGDWTVTPETLSWATIAVDKTAGTITVTPNGANTAETANEATLTVAHASDPTLKAEISLKQNGKGSAAVSYFVKVTTAPTDWSGKYLIVFDKKARSYVAAKGKDLISKNTNELSIIGDKIESNETVDVDMVEISKTTDGYKILLSDGKYLSVPASNACGSNTTGSVFTITLGKNGVSISGVDSKNATRTLCNNGSYYRMYPSVGSYKLPQLYKLDN